ncbi:MAG TPA: histidine ammonia-lyase [Acidimicrobiales bacterium]|nr:histidine ammonia-lyase [Acidimicrobiales bacterium]
MRVVVDGPGLTPEQVIAVARHDAAVSLGERAQKAIAASRGIVDALAGSDEPVYGVSTGFGALATVFIPAERRTDLQTAVIRSHAAGIGPAIEREVVRATMLLRLRSLAMGYSGVRVEVAKQIAAVLNAGITPVVPEHGSLGCSGDLAPLAHIGMTLMGEGRAEMRDGSVADAADALAAASIPPLTLKAKEGLALINGTDGMLANLVLSCADAARLLRTAEVAAAMSIEALLGTDRTFSADLTVLRAHPGQATSARNLCRVLAGSQIVTSHRQGHSRVQDAYSLRCAPQVTGAARDTLLWVEGVVRAELESAIDNPVVLADGTVASSGNFHGAPLALAADFLAIAAADVGSIAERRIDRLMDANRSDGLPPFLGADPGVDSGLMIAQYSAAALVAENRRLAAPASVDTIPTSAMQEDHVSMGWAAARKLRVLLANLEGVVAIELLAAARALDLRAPLTPSPASAAVVELIRRGVAGPGADRFVSPEIAAVSGMVADGSVVSAVEATIGALE